MSSQTRPITIVHFRSRHPDRSSWSTRLKLVLASSCCLPLYAIILWFTMREVCLPDGGWRAVMLTLAGALFIGAIELGMRQCLAGRCAGLPDGRWCMRVSLLVAMLLAGAAMAICAGLFGHTGHFPDTGKTPEFALGAILPLLVVGMIYDLVALQIVLDDMALRTERICRSKDSEVQRAQLDPHFVMNTINAVLPEVRESEGAVRHVLEHMASYMQYSLRNRHRSRVPLGEEFDAACEYLQLELTRFRDRMSVELRIDDAARQIEVPCLLLQPLVENAVKYGSMSLTDTGAFRVVLRVGRNADGEAVVFVANTAPVRSEPSKSTGFGLEYVTDRLADATPRYFALKVLRGWAVAKLVCEPTAMAA